jgi:hypothetical protein
MALQQYHVGGTYYGFDPSNGQMIAFPNMQTLLQYFPNGIDKNAPTLPSNAPTQLANQMPGQVVNPFSAPQTTQAPTPQVQQPTQPIQQAPVQNTPPANVPPAMATSIARANGQPDPYAPLPVNTPAATPNDPASLLTGPYAELYGQLKGYLDKLQANGQSVNPSIQITPEQIAAFTAQAQNEIAPYYANQLKVARQSLMQSLGYSTAQIQKQEEDLQKQYGNSLRTLAENSAENGFAQSGIRGRQQDDLATATQSSIDQARSALGNSASNAASQFAQTYGSSNLPSAPTLNSTRVLPGQSQFQSGGSNPLYTLSPEVYDGLTGTQQYQQTADINNRVSQLSGAANQSAVNTQLRSLTL